MTRQSFECPTSNRWGWRQRTQWNPCKLPGCLLHIPFFGCALDIFFLWIPCGRRYRFREATVFFFHAFCHLYIYPPMIAFLHTVFLGFVSNCLKREKGNLILRQYPVIVVSYTMFYPSNLSDQDSYSRDTMQSSYCLNPLDSRS